MRNQSCSWIAATVFGKKPLAYATMITAAIALMALPARSQVDVSVKPLTKAHPSYRVERNGQYGNLPLSFEPNVGQSNGQVRFIARGNGYSLFLGLRETMFLLKSPHALGKVSAGSERGSALGVKFLNANSESYMSATDELSGRINYLIGKDPAAWHINVPTFEKVVQHNVYRGIDVVYYGTQRQLECDFVVSPGSNPRAIALSFSGADKIRVDEQGNLVISVAAGDVRLRRPVAYQKNEQGERHLVAANYVLRGSNTAGISLGHFNTNVELVIDPILEYSTYLGGSNIDSGNAIAVAQDKTAFIAGGTFSTDFPTAHPLQPNHGGPDDFSRDAFVAKISADGSTLLYATYLGGGSEDVANGVAVDTFGNAYIIGTTISPDFPVTPGSFGTACGGDGQCGATWNPQNLVVSNAFVTKLNPEGSGLIYSGFLGEYENVKGQAIAVDANQVAYVTGQTGPNITPTVPIIPPKTPPPPFPITGNAAQAVIGGATDAYLAKISATGTTILYSTYIGGDNEEFAFGVAIDASANAYITGLSYSTINFPVTGGAFQAANGGAGDAFITKINTNGGPFAYSTLFGGAGLDQGNGIAVDSNNNVYVAGQTSSPGFSSPRPYGGNGDAFVAKFNPSLSGAASLVYFTYLGGSLADTAAGIALDGDRNAYVTGSTVSADFPIVGAVFQPKYGGGNADAFIAKIDPSGANILYSSFLGGSNTESGYGIAVDSDGSAYVAGQTCSLDFPLTNPEQASAGGNCDAFISKVSILNGIILNPNGLVFQSLNVGAKSLPQTVSLTTGDSGISIDSVAIGGNNPTDFAQTTTCGTSVPSGMQCSFSVTFSPTAVGLRKASLVITDTENGQPISHVVALTGSTSTVQLSVSTLSFGTQSIGTTSTAQFVTVTNVGTAPLTISSIVASNDFAETNNCTKAPLQPSTNCSISVTYAPSTSGSALGALTIIDNVPGSPQVVPLNGTGLTPDFGVSVDPSSAVVVAGGSTTVSVKVTSISGFAQSIALSCGGMPPASECTISPTSVTPSANGTATATATITTVARTMLPPTVKLPRADRAPLLPIYVLTLIIIMSWASRFLSVRQRRYAIVLLVLVAPLLMMTACNGGTSTSSGSGTPAGNYQITLSGTSGTTAHAVPVNLQVR